MNSGCYLLIARLLFLLPMGQVEKAGTADTAKQIQKTLNTDVMAHLTLAAQSRDDVLATADRFSAAGVRQILALRGDQSFANPFTDCRADPASG